MSHLTFDQILWVFGAAMSAGLAKSRESLLAGLSIGITSSLPTAGSEADQLLSDLHRLNTIPATDDGSVPFHNWLSAAIFLTRGRQEAHTFEQAREICFGDAAPSLMPEPSQSHDGRELHHGSADSPRTLMPKVNLTGTWDVCATIRSTALPRETARFVQTPGSTIVLGHGGIVGPDGVPVLYSFRGKFVSDLIVRYFLDPQTKNDFDHVAGILRIDPKGDKGEGVAAIVGIFTGDPSGPPVASTLTIERRF